MVPGGLCSANIGHCHYVNIKTPAGSDVRLSSLKDIGHAVAHMTVP